MYEMTEETGAFTKTYTSIGVSMNGPEDDLIVCIRMSHKEQPDTVGPIKEELLFADVQDLPTRADKVHLLILVSCALTEYLQNLKQSEVTYEQ